MKVSVIVPIYNVEEYLVRCVKSIQNQTLRDIEIILVDDGATDRSGYMCDEMARYDERIKVIHKKNGGLSDARNAGIDVAKGDFVFFVDSDDWIDEDTLELLYKIAIDENADIVECSYRNVFIDYVDNETANTGEMIIGDSVFALKGQMSWKYFKSVAWNKLYHKKIFEDGKRYPVGRYHEDEFFTHKAFCSADKLVYIDSAKYNYVRERKGSITNKVTSKILDGCYAIRERIDYLREKQMPEEILPIVQNGYCWILFDRLYRCYKEDIQDDKMNKLIEDLKKDKEEVLSWNIAEEYKKRYKIFCDSYELFVETYEDANKFREMIVE